MAREASRPLTGSRRSGGIVAAGLLVSSLIATPAVAQELPDLYLPDPSLPPPTPPPISSHYLQYGVALAGETVASPGQVCPGASNVPCILGNGGGLTVRVGYRSRGPWYLGGAYEFSRQDSANLLRLPILQQLRAELRVHLTRVTRVSPYLGAALGGVIYGNEWGLDTWGAASALGAGLEFQVTSSIVLNIACNYRQLVLRRWRDGAGQLRATGPVDFGLAHIVALEFGLEIREPLSRW
jgi:opacity protein-like surface antigen